MIVSSNIIRNAPLSIEDYALIGDCKTAALVGRDGAIDWLCLPRFDSPACFAALLGTAENGSWLIAPHHEAPEIKRSYRGDTMILETVFKTPDGEVALIDAMPVGMQNSHIIRRVEGRKGKMQMRLHIKLRFNYGASVAWIIPSENRHEITAIVGPDVVKLFSPIEIQKGEKEGNAVFEIAEGESLTFTLSHGPSHLPPPAAIDAGAALAETERKWQDWSGRCKYDGPWRGAVLRSLIVLRTLIYQPTGGIVAAPTTSLPEQIGGTRNWDYRYCWLRDATLTLMALMGGGFYDEAQAWGNWLQRSIAGDADQMQIMYSVSGERNLFEWIVKWLPGYQGAAPVRIGNAASEQLQLDVYGEVMDTLHQARIGGLSISPDTWRLQVNLIEHLEKIWEQPDDGIWEVRSSRRHFVHSKVMAWVAFDRAVQDMEKYGLEGPLERWKQVRDTIHADVCAKGFDTNKNSFTQSYGFEALDSSLLLIPIVGFLPWDDPRVQGTIVAVEKELGDDGYMLRYRTDQVDDGMPPGEGVFLPCSFWLADNYAQQGRDADAEALFERLLALRNDVGLIAEEYDPRLKRQVGNFPQAFSHLSIVNTALNIYKHREMKRSKGAHPAETPPIKETRA